MREITDQVTIKKFLKKGAHESAMLIPHLTVDDAIRPIFRLMLIAPTHEIAAGAGFRREFRR